MESDLNETVRQALLQLMEETLHSHQGVYTEEGTSLIETLNTIDAQRASKQYPGHTQTIAGHANHARYYLRNSLDMLQGKGSGDFDVPESWKISAVTQGEWKAVKQELEATYSEVMRHIAQTKDWNADYNLAVHIGMIAHSAYHLGAIRQFKDL